MALSPDVPVVAPLELITAAHLNAIRSNLATHDTEIESALNDGADAVTALTIPAAQGTVAAQTITVSTSTTLVWTFPGGSWTPGIITTGSGTVTFTQSGLWLASV